MKIWTTFIATIIFSGCGQRDYSASEITKDFCDCFNSNTVGDIDKRLTPCMDKFVNEKKDEILNSKKYKSESIEKALGAFTSDLLVEMTRTCDSYFSEINKMYNNYYPLDSSELNRDEINRLTDRINTQTNTDSIKSLLHKKVSKLIRCRQYEPALESIGKIKSINESDQGAFMASAYIYNQIGKYDKALVEIEKANEISGNGNLSLLVAITKRRLETADKK